MGHKAPNKLKKKLDAWEELGKEMNRPFDGELTIISLTGENEDEKKQWDRKSEYF
jgi:hypothetical protein